MTRIEQFKSFEQFKQKAGVDDQLGTFLVKSSIYDCYIEIMISGEDYGTGGPENAQQDMEHASLDVIPGDNPFGMRYIDFEGEVVSPQLWSYDRGATKSGDYVWASSYRELGTRPLDMETLLTNEFYNFRDLWVRSINTRKFQTRERQLLWNPTATYDHNPVTNIAQAVKRSILGEDEIDPANSRYYVDEFSFGDSPVLGDFDLTESVNTARNDAAAALFVYKLINEEVDIVGLAAIHREIGEIIDNRSEESFQKKLLTAFYTLFDRDIQAGMYEHGLLNDDNLDEVLSAAADWMSYLALEETRKNSPSAEVRIIDPFPTGAQGDESKYPNSVTLPYVIEAFKGYYDAFRSIVLENQTFQFDIFKQAYTRLVRYLCNVHLLNEGIEITSDDQIPPQWLELLVPMNERVTVLDEIIEDNLGRLYDPSLDQGLGPDQPEVVEEEPIAGEAQQKLFNSIFSKRKKK